MPPRRRLGAVFALLLACAFAAARAGDSAAPPAPPPACAGKDLFEQEQRTDPRGYEAVIEAMRRVPNAEGLLWRIEKPGIAPSYLFGTVHVTDERAVAVARSTAPYLDETHTVVTELGDAFSPGAKAALAIKLTVRMLGAGTEAASLISSADDRASIGRIAHRLHIDPDTALRMRPWLLLMLLSVPGCEWDRQRRDLPIVDRVVADLGTSRGEKLVGLETIDEQLDALASLDPAVVSRMLTLIARTDDFAENSHATMTGLYVARKIGAIVPILENASDLSLQDAGANRAFLLTIVERRNEVMRHRLKPLLDAGAAFVAVGALHLVGERGLVELLRRDGYSVTRVW